jgi:hypothetical protein
MTPALPETFRYHVADSGCWIWDAYCDANGYARIYNRERKRIEWAHRYSYEAHKAPLAAGYEVDHVCQQTNCVNPDHLDAVTKAEHARRTMERLGKDRRHLAAAHLRRLNMTYTEIAALLGYTSRTAAHEAVQAAVNKGLISADEVPRATFLSEVEREEIRDLYALGIPQTIIGHFYSVDSSQVSRICNGMTSGHSKRKTA